MDVADLRDAYSEDKNQLTCKHSSRKLSLNMALLLKYLSTTKT